MNNIVISGTIVREHELKDAGQTKVLNNCLAVKREFKKDETDFINITAFAKTAELINEYTSKGSKLLVTGRLQIDNYKDKDGNARTSARVIVDRMEFIGAKANKESDFLGEPVDQGSMPF